MTASTAIVLFTRDLRVHDNPALATACAAFDRVVPLFVLDPALAGRRPTAPGSCTRRWPTCADQLRERGGDLVVRHGDPVAETIRLAGEVGRRPPSRSPPTSATTPGAASGDCAPSASGTGCTCDCFPGVTVVEPGALRPGGGGDHYRVFTPYWRAWRGQPWRAELAAPRRVELPDGVQRGQAAGAAGRRRRRTRPSAARPGRPAAARRLARPTWPGTASSTTTWPATTRPGSARTCASAACPRWRWRAGSRRTGPRPFVRQLCWRDFYYQVTAAFPAISTRRTGPVRPSSWRYDDDALAAWQRGPHRGARSSTPGCGSCGREGWMHNRARLITAALPDQAPRAGLARRRGAGSADWLLDGDVANNSGNWQWVAGTGNDTRPYRGFNPIRQAERFDPDGDYVRRYVPELAAVAGQGRARAVAAARGPAPDARLSAAALGARHRPRLAALIRGRSATPRPARPPGRARRGAPWRTRRCTPRSGVGPRAAAADAAHAPTAVRLPLHAQRPSDVAVQQQVGPSYWTRVASATSSGLNSRTPSRTPPASRPA